MHEPPTVSRLIKALKSTGRRRLACESSLLCAIGRCPALHGRRASLALLREIAQTRAARFFPLLGEFARGGKPSITPLLARELPTGDCARAVQSSRPQCGPEKITITEKKSNTTMSAGYINAAASNRRNLGGSPAPHKREQPQRRTMPRLLNSARS